MKEILSTGNAYVKTLAKLKPSPASFFVEGYHLVEMATEAGSLDTLFFVDEEPSFPCKEKIKVSYEIIEKLSSSKTPEPILGLAHKEEKTPTFHRFLVLDRLQDPSNVGAILRSALAFGFHDIIFLKGTCSPFNPKAIASSQGALFGLNFLFLEEEELLALVKKENLSLYATALRNAHKFEGYPFDKSKKIGFIFGNEGKGVSETLLEKASDRLYIAMEGIESLNVSVAAGILLHSIYVL